VRVFEEAEEFPIDTFPDTTALEATTLPVRVVVETVNAFMVFEPRIWPYTFPVIVVIKELAPITFPVRVVVETVNAFMVFEPMI
jgi:hypothetical protein